jgi:Txe/YoeB family toxin of toxin-antitoxin system
LASRFHQAGSERCRRLAAAGLKTKAETLLDILRENPLQNPPPFEKLIGDLAGAYSRRINIQHRLIYQIYLEERVVKVIRLWSLMSNLSPVLRQQAASYKHRALELQVKSPSQ